MKTRTMPAAALYFAVGLGGVLLLLALLCGPGLAQTAPAVGRPQAAVVAAETAVKGRVTVSLDLTGTVAAYRVAHLASPAEGPVGRIRVREGDAVTYGQVLLVIGRQKGADALVAALRQEMVTARDNLQRTRRLAEIDALPGEALDDARTGYENARAALAKAEEAAGDHTVAAPWPGVVSRLLVNEGAFVAPRTPLVEMYDPSSLVIRAAVPERHAAAVQAGMRADVRLDAYPGPVYPARIDRVYPFLDDRLRTRTIEVLPDDPLEVLPGMFARLALHLKSVADAVLVPVEALQTASDGTHRVFMMIDGRAVGRRVTTGIEEGRRVQIESGIAVGETVIVRGHEALVDGSAVRVVGNEKEGAR